MESDFATMVAKPVILIWSTCFALGFILPALAYIFNRTRSRDFFTRVSLLLALSGSLIVAGQSIVLFWSETPAFGNVFALVPLESRVPSFIFTFYIDKLAALFLLLTSLLSICVVIYSFGYLRFREDRVPIAAIYNLFVLFGLWFVIVDDALYYILWLESVTLAFSFLVLNQHRTEPLDIKHHHAAKIYLILNHIGGILIAAAILFLVVTISGSDGHNLFNLSVFRDFNWSACESLSCQVLPLIIFGLAFLGFSMKVGIFPFHVWVALAHPSSPTNTHALSLGIMIKIGFYGMIRFFFEFLPEVAVLGGVVVLLCGGITAVIGVRNAIYSRDLKTGLAEHSVENYGIILAGIGLALILRAEQVEDLFVGLALLAALYHLINHTVFKALLYLATGAIEHLTSSVALNRLGGLIHRFPWTAVFFFIGSVAIAGFPPFNGFISEWLTLQALFAGASAAQSWWIFLAIVATIFLLAIAFALTATAFVKLFGEVFLGLPRDPRLARVAKTEDIPFIMRLPLALLACTCLLLGVFPKVVIEQLETILIDLNVILPSTHFEPFLNKALNLEGIPEGITQFQPIALLTILLIFFLFFSWRWAHKKQSRSQEQQEERKSLWIGGVAFEKRIMQLQSNAFIDAILNIVDSPTDLINRFVIAIGWSTDLTIRTSDWYQKPLETANNITPEETIVDPFRQLYNFIINIIQRSTQWFGSRFQNGDLRSYLFYMFLVFLLILLGLSFGAL